jgi:methionyl-tRNA formyltransferase
MKQSIVFFGSGWYTVPVIEKLLTHGLDLVVTTEKNPESKLLKFCRENNIKVLQELNEQDMNDVDVAVLASYGAIIPDEIIKCFKHGILNIHPSLLPKYKGPSPIQYQLLNGETVVGVTVIKLDNEVDHGPTLSQKPYNLQGNETSEDLLSILFEQGAEMVEELVTKLENGETLIETPQDHSQESWSYRIKKLDGMIDLSKIPSDPLEIENWKLEIARKVRAFYPWPGVWFKTTLKGQTKIVKLLPEEKIQVEGKNPMSYTDFINGFGDEGKDQLSKLHLI